MEMATFRSHGPALYVAPRCRLCGRGASDSVDLDGVVCGACLRRLNSDPLAKRRLILGFESLDW
jgi:hypothetical protein